MKPVFGKELILVRKKGIGVLMERKRRNPNVWRWKNHRALIAFFSVISMERMSKSRREAGPERKVGKRWQKP